MTPVNLTDEALARRVQHGDRAALAALVERHHSPLVGYLYHMVGGDRPLAEDMAQETFLRVMRGIGGYRTGRPFKPWLYAIATNLVRDHVKRAEHRYAMLDADETPIAGDMDIEGDAIVSANVEAVLNELMLLPEHQRAVIVLRYYGELSLSEIAGRLDLPVGTVKSRLSLGIRALREVMKAKGEREKPKT